MIEAHLGIGGNSIHTSILFGMHLRSAAKLSGGVEARLPGGAKISLHTCARAKTLYNIEYVYIYIYIYICLYLGIIISNTFSCAWLMYIYVYIYIYI